ncbi:MAG: glycosyltransferase family 2 protein [Selenomonadaceae bacterium]|nr:glycosyltransferase family 2 protein [Selenomonadaceae bacterium]
MANRIGAVVMVKNESDIIESFARHILQIADFLIVTDHDSKDRTVEILQSLIDEGLPIEIQFLHELGQLQAREINRMMYQAFEMGADIVLPMDADEFFIKLDGDVKDVGKIFQNLDPRESYWIQWDDYKFIEPTKDQNRFALSRQLAFDRPNPEHKVIVGRESILQNDLYIFRGNHHVVKRDQLYGNLMFHCFEIPLDENLLSLHIPFRSREQFESKYLLTWLTHVVLFSRRTFHVENHKSIAERILDGEKFSVSANSNSKPIDLSKYRDECELKFTDNTINPWKNLYRFAEDLADQFCRQEILLRRIPVSIFVLHHGDSNATLKTLESLSNQTYDPLEIFILPISTENLEPFKDFVIEDLSKSHGKYIQFVPAGDILAPETIEEFMSIIEPQDFIRCVISISESDAKSFGIFNFKDFVYQYSTRVMELFLYQRRNFNLDISNIFYRREFILNSNWLKSILGDGKTMLNFLSIMSKSVLDGMIGILNRNLISHSYELKPEDIDFVMEDWQSAFQIYNANKHELN